MSAPLRRALDLALVGVVVVGLAPAATGLPSASEPGPRKVIVKAGLAGDAKTAEAYLGANAAFVRETLPEIVRSCAAKSPADTVVSFDLTLTVGRGGKVLAATSDPSNEFIFCVSSAARKGVFTEPPRAPSDVYLEVTISR